MMSAEAAATLLKPLLPFLRIFKGGGRVFLSTLLLKSSRRQQVSLPNPGSVSKLRSNFHRWLAEQPI